MLNVSSVYHCRVGKQIRARYATHRYQDTVDTWQLFVRKEDWHEISH